MAAEKKTVAPNTAAERATKAQVDHVVATALDKLVEEQRATAERALTEIKAAQNAAAAEKLALMQRLAATDDAAATRAPADAPPTDAAADALMLGFAGCTRVDRRRCKPFATLEKRCKSAWATRTQNPRGYDALWQTLLRATTNAKDEKIRYGAAYLATFRCKPDVAIQLTEPAGRALLDALRREPKGSKAGPRMAELLSAWWGVKQPKLHADMERLMTEVAHPAPAARAEFVRLAGRYVTDHRALGELLIQVASAPTDDVKVRRRAVQNLPGLVATKLADDALATLAQIALARPGPLTVDAYGALGDAASLVHWPELVRHWRANRGNPIVGAAMARATWRYAVANYANETKSMPVRVAAFDVGVAVLGEQTTPVKDRALVLLGIQRGGHPNAEATLRRVARQPNRILAAAAMTALKQVKPIDPAFSTLVEPLARRPGR